jgi:hypothetical protein
METVGPSGLDSRMDTTIEQLPQKMISIQTLREAFDVCTPYNCPSRQVFSSWYPTHSWVPEAPYDIPMEKVVRILWYCIGHDQYHDRFVGFFAGVRVASYDVLKEYFTQTLVKT